MAEFCKATITWGGTAVKVYEASAPGESVELIDDTNLNSDGKEYIASDLHDSDEITIQVPESDADKFVVGETKEMVITHTAAGTALEPVTFKAVCSKKDALALKRGDRMIRTITLKKTTVPATA